ncbi:MAG: DUF4124 domain-containing protein [Gammaproteobacteria bacterium]|nr:DUF4124 domain-containing protein [Gammaproteobacteria bacterium]MCP5458481.1 DUF4124 domain-containing protein [Gammaproteobacteria bacterium]
MKFIPLLLTLLAGMTLQVQAEAIYKWRDATGKYQYTEVPPPSGDFEVLNEPLAPSEDPNKVMEKLRNQVDEAEKAREETEKKEQEKEKAQNENNDRAALIAKNCDVAKGNVKALESDQPVVRTDAQGNRIVLSGEERQKALQQARKDMDYYCKP